MIGYVSRSVSVREACLFSIEEIIRSVNLLLVSLNWG